MNVWGLSLHLHQERWFSVCTSAAGGWVGSRGHGALPSHLSHTFHVCARAYHTSGGPFVPRLMVWEVLVCTVVSSHLPHHPYPSHPNHPHICRLFVPMLMIGAVIGRMVGLATVDLAQGMGKRWSVGVWGEGDAA